MSRELKEALDILEKEKSISKDTLLEAIEQSLIQACKNHFGKADNVHVTINPETCDFSVYADRSIVEYVEDPAMEISLADALKLSLIHICKRNSGFYPIPFHFFRCRIQGNKKGLLKNKSPFLHK